MDQFVVPQFIDVEDKIFGPITVRQFLILLGAGIICFIAFRILELYAFIIVLALVGGGALVFAFVKIRGQAFHYFILNFIQTARKPGRRIWKKEYSNEELKFILNMNQDDEPEEIIEKKQVPREHIRQLSLQVNTGGYYRADLEQTVDEVDDIEIG